jgi:hypothetical protein
MAEKLLLIKAALPNYLKSYRMNPVYRRLEIGVHVFITDRSAKFGMLNPEDQKGTLNTMDNLQTPQSAISNASRMRRLGFIAAGVGLGSALAFLISRVVGGRKDDFQQRQFPDHIVDDRGTGQEKAARIIRKLRDRAFEASDEKLALALGRPMEEVAAWNAGQQAIDDDVIMKARGIAMHRGVHVD